MTENTVEHESPILIPLRPRRHKSTLHKRLRAVLFVGVERQDPVVHELNDVSQSGRVDDLSWGR